jgi:hypothetical protein
VGNRGLNYVVALNHHKDSYAYMKSEKDNYKKIPHDMDGICTLPLETETKEVLWTVTTEGMGGNILPKRTGQTFFDKPMNPFHDGMRTFFKCDAIGDYNKQQDGLTGLLEKSKAEREQIEKIQEFVTQLVEEGKRKVGLASTESADIHVTVACSLRQTRFETNHRDRTAPMIEMSYGQHYEMRKNGGKCVHALVPLSDDGMFTRFFHSKDDQNGTMIKLMPTTILMFPSTAIMEYGYLTNINGHRHLLFKILYSEKKTGTTNTSQQ